MTYLATYTPTNAPIAIAISELMIRLRSSTRCSKNVICPPVSAAFSGCSLVAILRFSGLFFALSYPLFASSSAVPASRALPNRCQQPAQRSAPPSPFRAPRSLPPLGRPPALRQRPLPQFQVPSRPPLLTPRHPPASQRLRAWPALPVASPQKQPQQPTPPLPCAARPLAPAAPGRASP